MKKLSANRLKCSALSLLMAASQVTMAEEVSSISEAFSEGKTKLNFRYRFESVDQDGVSKDAKASTLKSRITYKTAAYNKTTLTIEVDNVSYLGDDRFNNTRNGETTYPVVADPDGTHVNQAYFAIDTDKGNIRVGRQRINLDGQRFIGGVGWRQNEQTYDAIRFQQKPADQWAIDYSYINRVSRIFGPDNGAPADSLDSEIHLLNVAKKFENSGKLSGYFYAMDFDDAAALSNRTVGVSYQQTFKSGDISFPLKLEFARQDDDGDNPVSYSSNYTAVELGAKKGKFSAKAGIEILEGSSGAGEAFRTPLATLHKWQGWNDKFLNTPNGGIEDVYFGIKYETFALTWHNFDSESGSGSLGSEVDVSWAHKFSKNYSLLLKYGDYDADGHATDTRKAWLMFTASF